MKPAIKTLGKKLKAFRRQSGMTQPQLAKASGVATSIVNDIENGIRSAGSNTLNKIAQGLELPEEERFFFIMEGLRLSKRDFLIPDFRDFPPEILNFLPYALMRAGIQARDVSKIILPDKKRGNLQVKLLSGSSFSIEVRLSPC
jgi:transcriptional regulator with XRE-family HTH domain